MLKKLMLRSVASATAVGSVVAMSLAAGPATVSSAPAIKNVACTIEYQASVATTTTLSLQRSGAQFGVRNAATVTVSRDDAGARTPRGSVRIWIVGGPSWTVSLRDGSASVSFPRRLGSGETYTVRARYNAPSCSVFADSSAAPRYYTVHQARTNMDVDARNLRRGMRPRVDVNVWSATGPTPPGRVQVVLTRNAVQVGSKWARLDGGETRVWFPRKRPGVYDVSVRYPQRKNFRWSNGEDEFRIFRRR
jgi:hypothetical protein